MRILLLALTVLGAWANGIAASVDSAWVRTFDGFGSATVEATAMKLDSEGNPVVTGYYRTMEHGLDIVTIKYLSNGNIAWISTYDSPEHGDDKALLMATNHLGFIVVSGSGAGGDNQTTIWYNPGGDSIKSAQRNDSTGFPVEATGISLNDRLDTHIISKYNFSLTQLVAENPSQSDMQISLFDLLNPHLALGNTGSIYLAGWRDWPAQYLTVKCESAGDTVWTRQAFQTLGWTSPTELYVDDSEFVYVTGWSRAMGSNREIPWVTVKYDSKGNESWQRWFYGASYWDPPILKLAVDPNYNVYVAGTSWKHIDNISLASDDSTEFAVLKYAPDGDTIWFREFSEPGACRYIAEDMAVDAAGSVYITGSVGTNCGDVNRDIVTVKFSSDGVLEWTIKYASPDLGDDVAKAIAVDGAGNIFVAGNTKDKRFAIIKYVQSTATGVDNGDESNLPREINLSQNYPNPFNPSTRIEFSLLQPQRVEITIFNSLGQRVRTIETDARAAGNHAVTWDSRDDLGRPLASGIYFYTLRAGTLTETKKMVLLK
jgi:hypothetical protein